MHIDACLASGLATLPRGSSPRTMQDTSKEHLLELAQQALKEQDLEKLFALIKQIEELVEESGRRIPPLPSSRK